MAARELTLGKTVDSADDMARLMIVTQYAGSRNGEGVCQRRTLAQMMRWGPRWVTSASMMAIPMTELRGSRDINNVRLRSAGTYYFAQGCRYA